MDTRERMEQSVEVPKSQNEREGKQCLIYGRQVFPKDMRIEMKNSVHYGHPGRNAMFEAVREFW